MKWKFRTSTQKMIGKWQNTNFLICKTKSKTNTDMQTFKTEQEKFWAGEFGDEYIQRNISAQLLASNIHFFSKIIDGTEPLESVIEMGANVGMTLKALRKLLPGTELA